MSGSEEDNELLRRLLTGFFIAAGLAVVVVSCLWFAVDFMAASLYSPNLDQTRQVSDFNDLAYIAESLAGYHLRFGVPALIASVALFVLAVAINDRRGSGRPALISGATALAMVALLLAQGFNWLLGLLFLMIAVTLFLVTRWEWGENTDNPLDETGQPSFSTASDAEAVEVAGEEVAVIAPGEALPGVDDEQADWPKEPVLPTDSTMVDVEIDDEKPIPVVDSAMASQAPEPQQGETVTTDDDRLVSQDEPQEAAAEDSSLGLDFDSDLALELEQDYQLAHSAEDEPDPFDVLSQADLGIDSDELEADTIETAAAIEAEVLGRSALDQASTQEVEAMIDVAEAERAERLEEEIGGGGEQEAIAARTPLVVGERVAVAPVFDPQDLARQEALLPAPPRTLWTMFDWLVLVVIIVSLGLLLYLNI